MGQPHRTGRSRRLLISIAYTIVIAFSANAQNTGAATAKGTCIIANTGPGAKINQNCTVVDPELFKQFKAISDGTKNDAKLLDRVLAQLKTISEQINAQVSGQRTVVSDSHDQTMINSPKGIQQYSSGDNSPNTVNIDTHLAPSMTSNQQRELTGSLKTFAGSEVAIWTASPRGDVQRFAAQLATAMQDASIKAGVYGSRNRVGGDYPGVSCDASADRIELVKALAIFLLANHLISRPINVDRVIPAGHLDCTIASW